MSSKKRNIHYSPDELDQLIELTTPTRWVLWLGIIGLFCLVIGWSFYGQVSDTLTVKGIINQPDKQVLITAKHNGFIKNVELLDLHKPTEKDTLIATLHQPSKEKDIQSLKLKLKELGAFYMSIYKNKSATTKLEAEKLTYEIKFIKQKLKLLKRDYKTSSTITLPLTAKIREVFIKEGRFIKQGDPIAYIEKDIPTHQTATLYLTAKEIQNIDLNKKVLLSPNTINNNKFGYLIGTIASIESFKSYERIINTNFENKELSEWINNSNALYKVNVALKKSPFTVSGYKWTSKEGPPFKLDTKLMCSAKIVIHSYNPIAMFIKTKIRPLLLTN